jgi:hypothetical protein
LIRQPDYQAAKNYWKVLKNRLKKEGSESVTKCNRLKLEAASEDKLILCCKRIYCYSIALYCYFEKLKETRIVTEKNAMILNYNRLHYDLMGVFEELINFTGFKSGLDLIPLPYLKQKIFHISQKHCQTLPK